MSWEKEIRLACDQPDCRAWHRVVDAKSVAHARRQAARAGWTFTLAGGDRCAAHAP